MPKNPLTQTTAALLLLAAAILPQPAAEADEEPEASAVEDAQMLGGLDSRTEKALDEGDWEAAVKNLEQDSDAGDGSASVVLGELYEVGWQGLPKDYERAAELYLKAVQQEMQLAEGRLGYLYLKGLGVAQDREEADRWFRRAALTIAYLPDEMRLLNINHVFAHRGFPRAFEDALHWVREVDAWDARKQYELSLRYRDGKGVLQDQKLAYRLLRKAASNDLPQAQYELARAYYSGRYVAKDAEMGLFWMFQAADNGHVPAQEELGLRYAEGRDVEQNDWKAYYWLLRAREGGADVAGALARLDTVISPEDKDIAFWRFEERNTPAP